MTFYSTTTEFARTVFWVCANIGHDDKRDTADPTDLATIFLFVAVGLVLTAVFFSLGFGAEFGRILATWG
jgi:hypothetical protein